jgi:hypothetical protein
MTGSASDYKTKAMHIQGQTHIQTRLNSSNRTSSLLALVSYEKRSAVPQDIHGLHQNIFIDNIFCAIRSNDTHDELQKDLMEEW